MIVVVKTQEEKMLTIAVHRTMNMLLLLEWLRSKMFFIVKRVSLSLMIPVHAPLLFVRKIDPLFFNNQRPIDHSAIDADDILAQKTNKEDLNRAQQEYAD